MERGHVVTWSPRYGSVTLTELHLYEYIAKHRETVLCIRCRLGCGLRCRAQGTTYL